MCVILILLFMLLRCLCAVIVTALQCTQLRTYTVAVTSAIRGGALSVAGGYCVLAYLHWTDGMTPREARLVQGIMYRTYFCQFLGPDEVTCFDRVTLTTCVYLFIDNYVQAAELTADSQRNLLLSR